VTAATYRLLDELLPALTDDLVAKCSRDADRYMDLVPHLPTPSRLLSGLHSLHAKRRLT
jgi:hypothetical protein